jgi:hypothetical protein
MIPIKYATSEEILKKMEEAVIEQRIKFPSLYSTENNLWNFRMGYLETAYNDLCRKIEIWHNEPLREEKEKQ